MSRGKAILLRGLHQDSSPIWKTTSLTQAALGIPVYSNPLLSVYTGLRALTHALLHTPPTAAQPERPHLEALTTSL